MAYCTNQQLIDRVGSGTALRLTTDTGTTVDSAVIAAVIVDAQSEVDRHLAKRWATPIDTSIDATLAAFLASLTLDVAAYRLHTRRPPAAAEIKTIYDAAIKWLTDHAKGEVDLPGAVTPEAAASNEPGVQWGSSEPTASRENMV